MNQTTKYLIKSDTDFTGNRVAIQEALDSLYTSFGGGTVRLSGDKTSRPWVLDRPILLDADGVGLVGERPYRTRLVPASAFPLIITGCRPRNTPAECWETDTYTDGTAGTRYPIRTRATARPSFLMTPFDCGPPTGWSSVTALTVELGFRVHSQATPAAGIGLLGGTDYMQRPNPFYLSMGGVTNWTFRKPDGQMGNSRILWEATPGVDNRLTIQLDLDAGSMKAWVNGQAVTADPESGIPAGLRFADKEDGEGWGLGAVQNLVYGWGQTSGGPHDTTFFGLSMRSAKVYTDAATQARIDGQPINDARRYFTPDANTFAYLPLDENAPSDRLVKWRTYTDNRYGFGLFLRPQDQEAGATNYNFLTDLWVNQGGTLYGQGAMLGTCYDFTAERCEFSGCQVGLHGIPAMVAYLLTFRDCRFTHASVASVVAHGWTATLHGTHYASYTRRAGLLYGSNWYDHGCLVAQVLTDTVDCLFDLRDSQNGGTYLWEDGLIDYEGHSPKAYFRAELHSVAPTTRLTFSRIAFGTINAPGTFVRCTRRANDTQPGDRGSVVFRDCQWWGDRSAQNGAAAVRTVGDGWAVKFDGPAPNGVPPVIDAAGNEVDE